MKKTADGEAYRLTEVGRASAVQTREQGLAIAAGLEAQKNAVGAEQTTIVNVFRELANGDQRFVPENLALTIGGDGANLGTSFSALVPLLMRNLQNRADSTAPKNGNGETASAPSSPPAGKSGNSGDLRA